MYNSNPEFTFLLMIFLIGVLYTCRYLKLTSSAHFFTSALSTFGNFLWGFFVCLFFMFFLSWGVRVDI